MKPRKPNYFFAFFLGCILILSEMSIHAEELFLVPVGKAVGVTLGMQGISITETGSVTGNDGTSYSPAKDAGILPGDTILKLNGKEISNMKEMTALIAASSGEEITVCYEHCGENKECRITPALSSDDNTYKLGIWGKDAVSGIGTVTYYNPLTKEFGALGHGITDLQDAPAPPIRDGEIRSATVVSVKKGNRGQPGELMGVFSEDETVLGTVTENGSCGVKGKLTGAIFPNVDTETVPVANRGEVIEGDAEILSNIQEDKIESYSVTIEKINPDENDQKGMILRVTDGRLLEKTGGIVQGMSGSPILQNGKLIGAVTHVFVNDATHGYGIFLDKML